MIKVVIPDDKQFNYKSCKKLYLSCKNKIGDKRSFREIVENTFFYSFFVNGEFIGCIYYYQEDEKLFVNAFASRGHHLDNLRCLKMSFSWFNCDIYARTQHKTAKLCLYRCGFKKVSENLFKHERSV